MDEKTTGSWIVHHTHKLGQFQSTADYRNLRVAGKAGILLSALSATDGASLTTQQVEALATASGIDVVFELPATLDQLAAQSLIERSQHGIEILGLTTPTVLQHTATVFESLKPSPLELAAIQTAELCSMTPQEEAPLAERIGDEFALSRKALDRFLADARNFEFTDSETTGSDGRVYFNGNLFRNNDASKVRAIMASLSSDDERRITELDTRLRAAGCVLLDDAERMLGAALFKKLHAIAMYDVLVVSNPTENSAFVTRPSAFAKFGTAAVDDAFDLAKALVAALTYGMSRRHASSGRITMVSALLRKLISGQWVGPATAIGEDYRVLEMKRVIEVARDGNLFSMRLLKREVGEVALRVITQGDASEYSLPDFPGASLTGFLAPERTRETRRRKDRINNVEVTDLLRQLRTGR